MYHSSPLQALTPVASRNRDNVISEHGVYVAVGTSRR